MMTVADGSVKIGTHTQTFIVEGHGRVKAGDVIFKVVPGRGRVVYKVTASGGMVELNRTR